MKKLTVLSIVAASLLLVGCGESSTGAEAVAAEKKVEAPAAEAKAATEAPAAEAKEEAKAAATEVKEEAKTAATEAKEAATTAVEKTTEAVKETAVAAKDAVAEKAAAATAAVAEKATDAVAAATGPDGKALYAKCASCHGADGKTAALGKSAVIAGQSAADLETKIAGYKAGTVNVAGMGALMKGQVAAYSDEDVKAVSAYIAGL